MRFRFDIDFWNLFDVRSIAQYSIMKTLQSFTEDVPVTKASGSYRGREKKEAESFQNRLFCSGGPIHVLQKDLEVVKVN